MAKITIISVDLGNNIDDIVSDDLKELTDKNRADIQEAIDRKKITEKTKEQKTEKINQQARAKQAAMANVYAELLSGYEQKRPVPLCRMMEIAGSTAANSSGLVLQLKAFIRKEHENEYVLKRRTIRKQPTYELIPFNIQ
jgi:hypothetical protein